MSGKISQEESQKRDTKAGFVCLEVYKNIRHEHLYQCPYCQIEFKMLPSKLWSTQHKPCECIPDGYKDLTRTEWGYVRRNAKSRNMLLTITAKQAWEKFISQNKRCALTGLQLDLNRYDNQLLAWDNGNASLDRIDSNLGYLVDNVWWLHKTVNMMKSNIGLDDFLKLCELIVNPLIPNDINSEVFPRQYQTNFKGVGNLSSSYVSDVKSNAKKRNILVNVTIEQMWQKFVRQGGYCALTGLLLTMHKEHKQTTASLDRIDSSQDYVLHNIQWIHKSVNTMKKNLSDDNLLSWCNNIVSYSSPQRLPRLLFVDLDGTIFHHHGSLEDLVNKPTIVLEGVREQLQKWYLNDDKIIFTTGRRESMRSFTEKQLSDNYIFYDKLIMNVGRGNRVVINDCKTDSNMVTAQAIMVERNKGLKNLAI